MPSAPPVPDSSRLSVSSCRTSRAPRRAHRQPHRHLAVPRRRARQQQVGDVRAHDQQQQDDDHAENRRRSCRGASRGRRCRARPAATSSSGIALPSALVARQLAVPRRSGRPCSVVHAGARGLRETGPARLPLTCSSVDSRLQPARDLDLPVGRRRRGGASATGPRFDGCDGDELRSITNGTVTSRGVSRHALNARERRRQHADDGDRRVVDPHGLADDRRDRRRSAAARTRG